MKENDLEKEHKRKIDDLQDEVAQLKALNFRYKNGNEELKHQIVTKKAKDTADQIFECSLCNHKLNNKVDFINHVVANHTSKDKIGSHIDDKFQRLEIRNDELAESNNVYKVELEIKEEIIAEIKLKFTKIYTELIQRRKTETKHECNFCSFKGKSDQGLNVHIRNKTQRPEKLYQM